MELTIERHARSSVVGERALVVSQDAELTQSLQGFLRQDYGCLADTTASFAGAERMLRGDGRQSIFLDLRFDHVREDPTPLFGYLSQFDRRTFPVISLGGDFYRCEWASLADSLVSVRLKLPIERQDLDRVLRRDLVEALRHRPTSPSESRQVQTAHVDYKTYTPQMFQVLDHLTRVAAYDVTILLVGETGTGKTTLARIVHDLSPRSAEIFFALACGAMPPELIESELFGHVKGSFTGADRNKEGKFEVADRGTLLLDGSRPFCEQG